jgi:hypothetical protein
LKKYFTFSEREIEKERSEALKNKVKWKERNICCPVCREPMIKPELDELKLLNLDKDVDSRLENASERVVISSKMRTIQKEMKKLFEKQKLAGGIIDNKEGEIIVLNVIKTIFLITRMLHSFINRIFLYYQEVDPRDI